MLFACIPQATAHPADVTRLRVEVEAHRVEVRLTFNLLTLMRFVPIDTDQSGSLTLKELESAHPLLESYLEDHVPVSLNLSRESRLAPIRSVRPVWPTSDKSMVEAKDYDSHWVDFEFGFEQEEVVRDFWMGFEFFEDTSYLHSIEGAYLQGGRLMDVLFTASEPEFLYETGFTASLSSEELPTEALSDKTGSVAAVIGWGSVAGASLLLAGWLWKIRTRKVSGCLPEGERS